MEVKLDRYRGKKIAILGYGQEGKSTHELLKQVGAEVYVYDEFSSDSHPANTTVDEAEGWDLDDYDLVIRTPGLSPHRIKTSAEVSSATQIFFDLCPAKIIGVTGTKGKGTTSTLIREILSSAGLNLHLVGNIGKPAIDELSKIKEDDLVVFELSSFQLWDLRSSPTVGVVLMIESEHLDVHEDLDDYLNAKKNISAHQSSSDITIFHPFNELSERVAMNGKGLKKKYMAGDTAHIDFSNLMYANENIMDTKDFGLIGPHNRENICAAVTAAWEFTQDKDAIKKAVTDFKGLEHRLELAGEHEGVTYYNDSFATVPAAAIAAMNSFSEPTILVLGGSDKGSDYSDLAEAISVNQTLRKVILIGQMSEKIAVSLKKFEYDNYEKVSGDMLEVVKRAAELAESGDVVLLSPACASFDMFKNYKDRGEQFKNAVKALGDGQS